MVGFPERFAYESTPANLDYDDEVLLDRAKCIDHIAEYCDSNFCVLKEILRSNGTEPYEGFCGQCTHGYVWCPTKQAVLYSDFGLDTLLQIRALYDLKYIESQQEGRDIGKQEALDDWINFCAAEFRKLFNKGVRNPEIFIKRCVIPGMHRAIEKRIGKRERQMAVAV
jgi:hypothetical protein